MRTWNYIIIRTQAGRTCTADVSLENYERCAVKIRQAASRTHLLQERPELREEELPVLLRLLPHQFLQEPDDLLGQDAADPADEGRVLRLLPAEAEGQVLAVDDPLDEPEPLGE